PVDDTDLDRIASALQIDRDIIVDSRWVDNGPGWVAVLLDSAQTVLDIEPRRDFPTQIDIGVVGPYSKDEDAAFELRAIYSDHQGAMREDPVTGSLNASIGQWLLETGRATAPYTATQGACVGHAGRIEISQDGSGTVWVGGATKTLINGDFVARSGAGHL
ncbi:MAG: PhzF family phenazine biosynthesis protein, partial [Gammaproteobacteria bacterium]|nr:PhzF family phenazine biosynthesis protein [Gammaproteobacteria bacterium]